MQKAENLFARRLVLLFAFRLLPSAFCLPLFPFPARALRMRDAELIQDAEDQVVNHLLD